MAAAIAAICLYAGTETIVASGEPRKFAADGSLVVTGEVERKLELKLEDLAAMPRSKVTVKGPDAKPVEYEGVPLHEILKMAGVASGERLRGEAVSLVVLVAAPDGYRASFGIAELDPAFTDRIVLLADLRDGKPLADTEGPLRLVIPHEKRHARWVRTVESVTVYLPPAPPETKRKP